MPAPTHPKPILAMNAQALPKRLRPYADRIKSYSDETDSQDGHWVILKPQWQDRDGVSGCHERTLEGLAASLADCRLRALAPAMPEQPTKDTV